MLPAIRDSLTSGQPLYLLNSNANCGAPLLPARFAAALATQATGSVRLHVTARPPTTKGLAAAAEAGSARTGSAAASAPCSNCRRSTQCCGPGDSGSIRALCTISNAASLPARLRQGRYGRFPLVELIAVNLAIDSCQSCFRHGLD